MIDVLQRRSLPAADVVGETETVETDESMRRRAESFGSVADDYDRLRPGYPVTLFDDLLAAAGELITRGVLEVGAGTGRATVSLARRRVDLVALDPSAQMIRVMEERLRDEGLADRVTVREQRFDDLTTADGPFGVVVAAQSFHWADRHTRWRRLAELLPPGVLAFLFWNGWILDPDVHDHARVGEVYQGFGVGLVPDVADHRGDGEWAQREIRDEPLLGRAEERTYTWSWRLAVDDYLGLLATTSQYAVTPPEARAELFGRLRPVLGQHVSLAGSTLLLTSAGSTRSLAAPARADQPTRAHGPCGSAPGRKPWASASRAASRKPRAIAAGSCASLPKVTAPPPTSCHHLRIVACSGTTVLISRALPATAVAVSACRNSSSTWHGSKGPAALSGHERRG